MIFENLNTLSFLMFLLLNVFFVVLFFLFYKKREKLKSKYVLLFNQNKNFYIKYIFLFFSFFVLSLSLFEIKVETEIMKTYSNVDLVFTLDVSQSMNSLDYKKDSNQISRLDHSKEFIKKYIRENPENRYSLVIFAWDAISVVPLSENHSHLLWSLVSIDYKKVLKQWSDLQKAINSSLDRLYSSNPDNKKIMILLSDGGDKTSTKINEFDEGNLSSFVVWVWKKTLSKIPIGINAFWKIIYKRYNWKYVETNLNEKSLKDIASEINWIYSSINNFEHKNSFSFNDISSSSWEYENKDFSRILSIIWFLFFLIYLIFPFNKWKKL